MRPDCPALDLEQRSLRCSLLIDLAGVLSDQFADHFQVAELVTIDPGKRALIPTGIAIALPPGYELQIRPRSGLALRHGIVLPNSPGTIDEDYRGEIQVIVLNAGDTPFTVERGARIAQAVLAQVVRARWHEVESLEATEHVTRLPRDQGVTSLIRPG